MSFPGNGDRTDGGYQQLAFGGLTHRRPPTPGNLIVFLHLRDKHLLVKAVKRQHLYIYIFEQFAVVNDPGGILSQTRIVKMQPQSIQMQAPDSMEY